MALKDYYLILGVSRTENRRVESRTPFVNSSSNCIPIG